MRFLCLFFAALGLLALLAAFNMSREQFYVFHHHPDSVSDVRGMKNHPTTMDTSNEYEVTHTNFAWNSPNDLNFSRRIVTGEFYNATLKHARYNRSAWADIEQHPELYPNRTIIAFMDVDTCLDFLYPIYIKRMGQYRINLETANGRYPSNRWNEILPMACEYVSKAAASPVLLANPKNRLVVLDCGGWPHHLLDPYCVALNYTNFGQNNKQVIFATYSQSKTLAQPNGIGLPAPAIKPIDLTPLERQLVQNCTHRPYLLSFQGTMRPGRESLANLNNGKDVQVHLLNAGQYIDDMSQAHSKADTMNYAQLMKESTFGAVPRGDALYSYRFAEGQSIRETPHRYIT
jgi:hypothetical protein